MPCTSAVVSEVRKAKVKGKNLTMELKSVARAYLADQSGGIQLTMWGRDCDILHHDLQAAWRRCDDSGYPRVMLKPRIEFDEPIFQSDD